MNRPILSALALGAAAFSISAAANEAQAEPKPKVEVVQRDANGRALTVSIDGQEYKLCSKTVTDSCINPRDAGFDWGGVELDYWPGKPASEIDHKLPEHQPAKDGKKSG